MFKNNIKLIIATLIGILLGSVTVYAITVKSENVTYIPDDETWDVSNVSSALNDLYENINKGDVYYLGTSRSFNIKSLIESGKLPASIDYTKLTSNNFIVAMTSFPNNSAGYCSTNTYKCSSSATSTTGVSKSYNSSTGVVSISGGSSNLKTCINPQIDYCNDANNTVSATVYTYLVVGEVITVK